MPSKVRPTCSGSRLPCSQSPPTTCQNDLWELPELVANLLPDHLLDPRPHRYDSFVSVRYAVPPDRKV